MPAVVLAHVIAPSAGGVPLPHWLSDLVLVGIPLLVLAVALVVLEARTRPTAPRDPDR